MSAGPADGDVAAVGARPVVVGSGSVVVVLVAAAAAVWAGALLSRVAGLLLEGRLGGDLERERFEAAEVGVEAGAVVADAGEE